MGATNPQEDTHAGREVPSHDFTVGNWCKIIAQRVTGRCICYETAKSEHYVAGAHQLLAYVDNVNLL
jgi:hypothetical protein